MKTEVVSCDKIEAAADLLKRGELVAFPTETVYGLGASVFNTIAVEKIFIAKGRPSDNPLIVHISSLDQASRLSDRLPKTFFLLADRFWPGPLTLIVPRHPQVPAIVSAGHPTIAIRMPIHSVASRLISMVGEPIAAPSANVSGRPSPTSAQDVLEDLEGRIPMILDGGACPIGIESTVLSLVSPQPVLLRPGSIRKEELEEALQTKIAHPSKDAPTHSPGMKYRHYAPKAKVKLVFDQSELTGNFVLTHITSRNLYAALRRADRLGALEVEILCTRAIQSDEALMNRLLRASGQLM